MINIIIDLPLNGLYYITSPVRRGIFMTKNEAATPDFVLINLDALG